MKVFLIILAFTFAGGGDQASHSSVTEFPSMVVCESAIKKIEKTDTDRRGEYRHNFKAFCVAEEK